MKLPKNIAVSVLFFILVSQINTQGLIPPDEANNGYSAVPVNPLSDLHSYISNFIINQNQTLNNWTISDIWQKEDLEAGSSIYNFTYSVFDANNNLALIDSRTISVELNLNILSETQVIAHTPPPAQGIDSVTQNRQITGSLVELQKEALHL